jgi:hypothetical protein
MKRGDYKLLIEKNGVITLFKDCEDITIDFITMLCSQKTQSFIEPMINAIEPPFFYLIDKTKAGEFRKCLFEDINNNILLKADEFN